ncbi:condensation domain-containing protein [Streptosporangium sp. 'caverna']|uniref:condensation domain-containing protein n=1 Tax=Streptosporangium sp. 'caverna' TaxID=2202249 RepID=UPI0013A68F63|nr:condensation domain-containing protein [Streptosporangium sp. 'caverna']
MNSDGATFLRTDPERFRAETDDPAPASRVPPPPEPGATADGTAVVEFTGARGGVAPLTWGQSSIWRLTTWRADGDSYFNMPWTLPVYGRRDLDTVLGALRRLLERHETLRTNFRRTPGGMVQHVTREGRLTVQVVDGGHARPLTAARELAAGLAAAAFDYEAELPVRCAVVTIGGRPRAVAFGLSHLAADGGALGLLAADWRDLLAGNDPPEPTWQPMDQAAFEREGPGAVRGERAVRYWQAVLEKAPAFMFDYPRHPSGEPRFIRILMRSVALGAAAETLAARWSVSTASVLTTASAVLLSTLTGHRRIAMQLIGANRHDPRIGALVGPAAQDGIFMLELPGGTLAEATRIGHRQALTAYRHAHYEPLGLMAMREEVGRRRGGPIDLSAYFNDTRGGGDWPDLPALEQPGDPAAIAALTGRTTFAPAGSWDHVDATTVQFIIGPARETCELHLLADTAYLPRTTVHTLLRGMETLLVSAVAEDVPLDAVAGLCDITPVDRPPGWERSQTGPAGETAEASDPARTGADRVHGETAETTETPETSGSVVAEAIGG